MKDTQDQKQRAIRLFRAWVSESIQETADELRIWAIEIHKLTPEERKAFPLIQEHLKKLEARLDLLQYGTDRDRLELYKTIRDESGE